MDDAGARDEMLELVRRARQRLTWERDGGVDALPRATLRRALPRRGNAPTAAPVTTSATTPTATSELRQTPAESGPALAAPWMERNQVAARPSVASPAATPTATIATSDAPSRRDPAGAEGLRVIREELGDCRRCKLAPMRQNIVFGVGNPSAPLVFVGEAPGENEDKQGEPFVGKAGELLTRMIAAMGFARDEVYICNVIKCRPPGNRNPEPDEIAACEPFLIRQLGAIAPRVIVTLGKFAAQALLRSDAPISAMRGQWKRYQGIALMPTFHPAFLLRDPSAKRVVWDDLKAVMAELDRLGVPRRKAPEGGTG